MLHMTYKEVLAHYGCKIRARVQIFQIFAQHGSQDRALAQKSTSTSTPYFPATPTQTQIRALAQNIWTVWIPFGSTCAK